MREISYDYKKFQLKIQIPAEVDYFMKAVHMDEEEILDKEFWKMQVEDDVFFSHEKHPTEKGYSSHEPNKALSKSVKITALVYGLYLTSKKVLELDPKDFDKTAPLIKSSCNMKSGWRIYFSFYD